MAVAGRGRRRGESPATEERGAERPGLCPMNGDGRPLRFGRKPEAIGQLTMSTEMSLAWLSTFWEMLPRKNSLMADRPRRPITIMSYAFSAS